MNPKGRDIDPMNFDPFTCSLEELKSAPAQLSNRMRLALLANGVDINRASAGFTSVTHTADDVAETVAAYRESLRMLRAEDELPA